MLESIPWKKVAIVLAVIILVMAALKLLGLCPLCKMNVHTPDVCTPSPGL